MTPQQLTRAREALGLTQKEIAAKLRIHWQVWYKWERGEASPPAIAVTAINWLVTGEVGKFIGE